MKAATLWFFLASALVSGVSASCRTSGPGTPTFDGGSGCKKGMGFDHRCPDGTAFFMCCSNANCT
ncbi:hypothetical protein CMUS01_15752 [Colletotrichum musicola]|uniref:Uncharacterized protein n=1 Tax=Colletotrichum musicola TaxID=2175873 RepID=A0A8H6IUR0_9PEZI|nr:hypothetical protein CMUS01_15752 [Colletotrichum musicola]